MSVTICLKSEDTVHIDVNDAVEGHPFPVLRIGDVVILWPCHDGGAAMKLFELSKAAAKASVKLRYAARTYRALPE